MDEGDPIPGLRDLDRPEPPPPSLEAALMGELDRRSHRRDRRRIVLWAAAGLAGAGLVFASGWAAGARQRPDPPRYTHALLLEGGTETDPGTGDDRRREYGAWARSLLERGVRVHGEELEAGTVRFGPEAAPQCPVVGLFLLEAPDDATARSLASSCPHVRHGGTVELRRVHP